MSFKQNKVTWLIKLLSIVVGLAFGVLYLIYAVQQDAAK
jgi:uncharacterized membrane-anchored protein YhcB (DUF1043 family)